MKLRGWTIDLPEWIQKAIEEGKVVVKYSERDKFDYLVGEARNPWGILVQWLE